MKLTPFHSDSIWETYSGLRPRSKTPYKQALLKAIDGCIDQGIHNPRILVLGAGPGTYDVDLIFQALDERQKTPADGAITVVDWNQHDSLRRSEVNFIKKDIEEFLASPSGEPFNVVVAFLVVHHLVNWRLAMANIAKVASGGFLVFDEYECMKAGWIDWIDGTTGFVGLDLQLPQTDAAGKWSAFFRDYYSQLDKNNGIFWEPEVRGTDYKRFHRALTYSGFSDQGHCKENVAGNLQQLSDSFKALDKLGSYQDPTRLFSQFTWGSEMGSESYLKQFIDAIPENKSYAFIKELFKSEDGKKNSSSEDSNQDITFTVRVNTYGIPKAESLPVVANRLAETYWFEGFHDALFHRLLLLHIEELSTESEEYEKLQRKKLVQYLIFSGGFTQALVFAAPVLMTIKKISGWVTETSKASILVINDASEKKSLLNGHMKRMASFTQHKNAGSVTESFLNLRLPISIVLRVKETTDSDVNNRKASTALHDLHTGKLVEVAIPEYLLGEDNCGCKKENTQRPISPEWCFSRFRAGILTGLNDPQEEVCKHTNQEIEFEWEENGHGASDKACHDIEEWVNKILPFLAPLLKQHIRVVIIGLYHVRVDDEGYGGLGSVFLAENIAGKLTEFDIERFRFMQAETQKFSSIYMIESLRKVVSSEEVLSKQKSLLEEQNASLKKFEAMMSLLQRPLDNLTRALNETQQDTQKLRAILYDPHHAIFAAAPSVMRFFEQSGTIDFGALRMEAVHSGTDTKFSQNDNGKKLVAGIICKIFGAKEGEITAANLYSTAEYMLKGEGAETGELARLCRELIGGNIFEKYEVSEYIKPFNRLKEVLFTPYKDGDKNKPMWALLMTIYGHQESLEITVNLLKYYKLDAWHNSQCDGEHAKFLLGLDLPVPRYSSLLSLISGVIAYAGHGKLKSVEIENVPNVWFNIRLTFVSSNEIFITEKIPETFNEMVSIIGDKKRSITYAGNFLKPFCDFSEMCIGQCAAHIENASLKLAYSGGGGKMYTASLTCAGNIFSFGVSVKK